jgi:hypothetical protein
MYPNYQQPTQIGFTGSQVGVMPSTMDKINPSHYNAIKEFIARFPKARLASFSGLVLYDTLRVDPGVLPQRDFVFFQNGLGQNQGLVVANTQYAKQEIDIHPWITTGGQFNQGYEALIWGIGVQVHIVSSLDESLQTSGNAVNLALDPGALTAEAATDPIKMGNVLRAYQESLFFSFFLNSTDFEVGPLWRFPAGIYGQSGFASMCSGATAPAFAVTDGAVNNGMGACYQMPILRHLPSLTKFGVRMKTQNPFTTANVGTARIVVTLEGIGIQPVTG